MTASASHPLPLGEIDHWVFDLDNTLYPASKSLFPQIDARMKRFIARLLDLPIDQAHALQKKYYRDYGTTLRGLMTVHGIDPREFLEFVHDIDHGVLERSPRLDAALGRLPGRKVVFTNGSRPHAEKVLRALGVEDRFDAIFDIVDADYIPKPDPRPYGELSRALGVDPTRAVMVEDLERNLVPAADLGMITVLLHQPGHPDLPDGAPPPSALPHVHHVITDLDAWLEELGLQSVSGA